MPPIVERPLEPLTDKQPIKWMELPIMKFNEIAVPHHVNQLKTLKLNIQKCQRSGDWTGACREQNNATVVVKQLRTLVRDMDTLRHRVIESDVNKFDRRICDSRQAAVNILQEFIDLSHQLTQARQDDYRENSVKHDEEKEGVENNVQLQQCLDITRLAEECQQQERCAIAWENLQREIEEVHHLYEELAGIVHEQGESVTLIENNVEVAEAEVVQAERHLLEAVRTKAASYPLYGALIGTCMGGPIGFMAGLKIGGLVALTGSVLGFTGGRMLKERQVTS